MSFFAANGYFLKNGKPVFVISGEIHYFRVDPRLWKKHLTALKQSGANTTSTYIPWDWHEPEEGLTDFTGKTHPGRNLIRYIELCQEAGLDLIVKPGPYILAEYESHGLPGWLLERCSDAARAQDEHGAVIAPDLMSYMSEEFLEHSFRWYDSVMPVLARHQEHAGGPITMMQVCNEVGVFQWLSGRIDYNPRVIQLYREFLTKKYREIGELNKRYGTVHPSFACVEAPRGMITRREEYRAYVDFHLFYRHYFALYLDTLAGKIRSFGIDVQLTHNIPGWIFGNAAELPMLMSTYEEVMRTRPDMVFGLDHIPEFVSFRNAHSGLASNKILSAMQPHGPVWAAEYQAGSREHFVKNDPADMEMFYRASLAHGLNSFNYYMFSQGMNPPGRGFYGRVFYHQTPLDAAGTKSELYAVIRRYAAFIRREGVNLLTSRTHAKVCAGLYTPYFHTELTTSQMLREKRLHSETLGLTHDPKFVREELFFNGLLRGLQTLNHNYDIRDLQRSDAHALARYTQLWVVTTDFMDLKTQDLLVSFVTDGGHLVIYPAIPLLDEYLQPCTILRDGLGLRVRTAVGSQKVDAFGIEDVFTHTRQKQVFHVPGGEVVAVTKSGEPCGVRASVGKGRVTALGFAFGYTTDENLLLFEKLLSLDRIRREVRVSDPDIQFVVRHGENHSLLFLLNYHNRKKTFTVGTKRYSMGPFSCKIIHC